MDAEDLGKLLFYLACLIFIPLLAIWSLNTLFALSIGYTLKSWGAMVALMIILNGNTGLGSKLGD